MPDTRPVWLTREQRNVLEWAKNHLEGHAHDLSPYRSEMNKHLQSMARAAGEAEAAWDAAPADAPLVVELARKAWHADVRAEQGENAAVLRALGMPDA